MDLYLEKDVKEILPVEVGVRKVTFCELLENGARKATETWCKVLTQDVDGITSNTFSELVEASGRGGVCMDKESDLAWFNWIQHSWNASWGYNCAPANVKSVLRLSSS